MGSRRSRANSAGASPRNLGLAVLLLAAGGWVWADMLFGGSDPVPSTEHGEFELPPIDGAETADDAETPEHDAASSQRLRMDLLEAWGSHVQNSENDVPNPFRRLPGLAPAAAPGGAASVATPSGSGTGPDARKGAPPPPDSVRLSLVFRAGTTRRAIVNGNTVGVGDAIAELTVHGIHADGIELATDGDVVWFYDFQSRWPRGYVPSEAEQQAADRAHVDQHDAGVDSTPDAPMLDRSSRGREQPSGDLDLDQALRELLERREAARTPSEPSRTPPPTTGSRSEPGR